MPSVRQIPVEIKARFGKKLGAGTELGWETCLGSLRAIVMPSDIVTECTASMGEINRGA